LLRTQNVWIKFLFTSKMIEQKSCFAQHTLASKMFGKKSCFAPKMFEQLHTHNFWTKVFLRI
jgi:hypothetical protein